MKHMKIGMRLALGFGAVILLVVAMAGMSLPRLAEMDRITQGIVTKDWQKTVLANDIVGVANENGRANMEMLLVTDLEARNKILERIDSNTQKITELLEKLDGMISGAEEPALVEKIRAARTTYTEAFSKASKVLLGEGRRFEASRIMMSETSVALKVFIDTIEGLIEHEGKSLEASGAQAKQHHMSGRLLMFVLSAVVLLIGSSCAFWVTRSVTRPMAMAVQVAEGIAASELYHDIMVTVAAEVRKLAQRSAEAAKEIKALISDSVEKIEGGTRLVDASGQTLHEIVTAVKKVSDIVAEIALASQEQSAGIEQVNKAVMQMDEMTQQNAALVEEAAAASESVDTQARGLQQLMAFFTIEEGTKAPDSPRAAVSMPTPTQSEQPTGGRARPGAVIAKTKPGAVRQGRAVQHDNSHQRSGVTANRAGSDWVEF